MKKGLTELAFILDRSGSMSGLEADTIGGYNSLLKKQKLEPGECIVTTVLFDDRYELLHDRIGLKGVQPITDRDYYVRGSTALLDAIGRTVGKLENAQRNTAEPERAEKVMVVIITDGMENASREYGYDKVRQMVERMQKEFDWQFLFLGANMDAIQTASRFGVAPAMATTYHADSEGVNLNFAVLSETVSAVRASRFRPKEWKKRIDEDFQSR